MVRSLENRELAAVVAIIVVFSGVAVIAFWPRPAAPDVRIGFLSQDLHQLALKVAQDNGMFEEANLTVETVVYGNGAEEMRGFQAGQIDMGYLGAAPALTLGINSQIQVTILAAANYEGSALMVKKDLYDAGVISDITDLAGKTIYHPGPSTVQNFLLRLALNQSGMTVNDVFLEQSRPQDMAISLTVDSPAFIAWEPFPARAQADGLAEPLVLSGDIWARHPCCVLAASNDFIEGDPVTVQKVVDIHRQATEWIANNPSLALDIAINWLGMAETTVETAFNRIIYDYNVNKSGIERYLVFLIEQDIVEMDLSEVDDFLDMFIDDTYALATCSC
ncbi:MAG: ABC transporter substrate-binding protein [Candidatus Thorarchaeota archaeon]|nr:MAG: ABC transporter substrate-binding protein [Candidatus Thorarchaeota archaeon]